MNKRSVKRKTVKMHSIVIVHGKSELCICKNIQSNLRIKQEIISRDHGASSIQINGLLNLLEKDRRFRSFKDFKREFCDVEYDKNKLLNFKLFTIMDVDDCDDRMKNAYMDRTLFMKHWLYEYIVPIYNDPNLEKTMRFSEIEVNKKKDYITLFPTSHGNLDVEKANAIAEKMAKCRYTNLEKYINYCLSIRSSFKMDKASEYSSFLYFFYQVVLEMFFYST